MASVLAVEPSELGFLILWAIGVAAAVYATTGAGVPLVRRIVVVLAAVLVPVLGTLVALVLAASRFRRGRRADGEASTR